MFQQIKKISSSLGFKDLIDGHGLSEEELKNFSRQRIQAVKTEWESIRSKSAEMLTPSNLSPRLSSLTPMLTSSSGPNASIKSRTLENLDLSATTQLAARYEEAWNAIRAEDERNYKHAAIVDDLMTQVLSKCEVHYENCELLKTEASQLSKLKEMVENLTIVATQLKDQMIEMDKIMIDFEKGREEKAFEEWKQSEYISFNQYMDNKNAKHEGTKAYYREQYEEFQKNIQIQKVHAYQADFEAQMERYRREILSSQMPPERLPNFHTHDITTTLEDLELETPDDRKALEDFLGSPSNSEEEKGDNT